MATARGGLAARCHPVHAIGVRGSGRYTQGYPRRTVPLRCRPRSGCAAAMRASAILIAFVTARRARSRLAWSAASPPRSASSGDGNWATRLAEETDQVEEPLRVVESDHLAVVRNRPVLPLAPEDVLLWRDAAPSGREE